jgi:hypothetical protein
MAITSAQVLIGVGIISHLLQTGEGELHHESPRISFSVRVIDEINPLIPPPPLLSPKNGERRG